MTSTTGRRIILTLGESRVVGRLIRENGYWYEVEVECTGGEHRNSFRRSDGWQAEYPAELPTKPYAVVAPPGEQKYAFFCYVLEPEDGNPNGIWRRSGFNCSIEEVTSSLASGWRVVFEGVED